MKQTDCLPFMLQTGENCELVKKKKDKTIRKVYGSLSLMTDIK